MCTSALVDRKKSARIVKKPINFCLVKKPGRMGREKFYISENDFRKHKIQINFVKFDINLKY